jgi:ACS family hexuronate transporter-like MFS transporter
LLEPGGNRMDTHGVGLAERRASGWAWGLCWLMFASTVLNYMDRQTITLVKEQMSATFAITSDVDFGWVLAAFSMTYALFQVPAGYLVDRWDLRWSYAAAVAWWSLAAMATAIVPGLGMLIACRALLGVGESFNWPCALRVTGRILPPSDRSLGNGIFNSGAAVGAVVTPIVVTALTHLWGWRAAFLMIGALGFVWVAVWLALVQGPPRQLLAREVNSAPAHGRASTNRRGLSRIALGAFALVMALAVGVSLAACWLGPTLIWLGIAVAILGPLAVAALLPRGQLEGAEWAESLGDVVRMRRFWVMVVVAVSINICWHFLVSWIPTVLKEQRGLTFMTGNFLSAIPFLAADAGNLGGGWLSRRLAARGRSAVSSRQIVMSLCIVPIVSGTLVSRAPNDITAVVLLSVMAAGTAAFMANYFTFAQEISAQHTGLVVGYLGGVGNLFVAGFQPFAGKVKDLTGSFSLIFVIIGFAPLLGLLALLWGWRKPIAAEGASGETAMTD